jgi:glycosyltransferase involved in cell wall biosynthesis
MPNYIIIEPDVSICGMFSVFPFRVTKHIKLILDIRSTPVEIYGFRGYLKKLSFTLSVLIAKRFFDGVTIITSHMKKEICEEYDIDPEFVGVWTSGVSTEVFDPKKYITDGKKLRENLGLSRKFIIFYHGAFSPNRGLIETIEAIDIVRQKHSDAVLFLLGSGSIVDNLKSLVEAKKLQNNVIIHPPVKYADVPKYIAMSDVCLVPLPKHPYWNFQCPLNLLEYLAMEKPVIITDIPANRSVVGDNRCGIYIRSIRPIEIANAIEYAYNNKVKLAKWGKLGRKIVSNNYSWDKVAEKFEEYLLSMR